MTGSTPSGVLTAILPCNNLDASESFYRRLGFTRMQSYWPPPGEPNTYRLLSNGKGGYLHLTDAVEGWLVPGRNPFGLYLYLEDVDALDPVEADALGLLLEQAAVDAQLATHQVVAGHRHGDETPYHHQHGQSAEDGDLGPPRAATA